MPVIRQSIDAAQLRREVRRHLRSLGFTRDHAGALAPPTLDKATYREMHAPQRRERIISERAFVATAWPALKHHFAEGTEVCVDQIRVRLELIDGSTWQSDLFRLACLLWSVPVSRGYGRRLRFLVWDDFNQKLIGIFALGDPVFNLRDRDAAIGWTGFDRKQRLVGVMDAYVLGAVPPYNKLLGGKLVASMIRTRDVAEIFREKYRNVRGKISGKRKAATLVLVTTTSSLGRSSLYNRLALDGIKYFRPIGYTTGFGHFHFPEALFNKMKRFLERRNDDYAESHGYGEGANWRLRTIKRALIGCGLKSGLIKHGLRREVFICEMAANATRILRGEQTRPNYKALLTAREVGELALRRWLLPRSERDDSYRTVTRHAILDQILARTSSGTAISRTSGAERG